MGTENLSRPASPQAGKQANTPQTPYRLTIDGKEIVLTLRRSRRRSLALQVDRRGPRILAPAQLPLHEINRFIHHHIDWLKAQLAAWSTQSGIQPLMLHHDAVFPLFGKNARLHLAASLTKPQWQHHEQETEEILCIPPACNPGQVLLAALRQRALTWYRERVEFFCRQLECPTPDVRLSNARTRWGSCSRISGIRLHWRLIHLAPELIDYVIAHEVAHLIEMNHSPRFWAVVSRIYPDWRSARQQLRVAARFLPIITP